jgi:predicted RNA-binding protein YlqC (UPF0109 family)
MGLGNRQALSSNSTSSLMHTPLRLQEETVKELVEYIAKSLVDDPSQVSVTEIPGTTSVILELRVAPEDMGRVIGRNGRVANAMRTLLRVLAAKEGKRVTLEIV